MGKTFAKTTARSVVNNICLIKTTAKKEKGVRKAKKETNYTEDQSLWIARSKYNLKDGKSVWNNIGIKRVP